MFMHVVITSYTQILRTVLTTMPYVYYPDEQPINPETVAL
jgi:hypothetical protein